MIEALQTPASPKNQRLISIDALRGFVVLWLFGLGSFLGDISIAYDTVWSQGLAVQMSHVYWEGLHVWDLVMPLFLFITGCSMVFSFEKRLQTQSKLVIFRHIAKRVIILWILGMVVQGNLLDFKWKSVIFFSNTLQAIAIGYLGASAILFTKGWRCQAAITTGLIGCYWIILHFVPVPGGAVGLLTPEGNFSAYIDRELLANHADGLQYSWILPSLTFIVTVMLGCFCGKILKLANETPLRKGMALGLLGGGILALGYILALHDPCIKPIWSPSFTLISGGYCILLLAIFYFVIDVLDAKIWSQPLVHLGSNALFVYILFERFFHVSGFLEKKVFFVIEDHVGIYLPLLCDALGILILWVLCYVLYRKRIFIKI